MRCLSEHRGHTHQRLSSSFFVAFCASAREQRRPRSNPERDASERDTCLPDLDSRRAVGRTVRSSRQEADWQLEGCPIGTWPEHGIVNRDTALRLNPSVQAEIVIDRGLRLERQTSGYCYLMVSTNRNTAPQLRFDRAADLLERGEESGLHFESGTDNQLFRVPGSSALTNRTRWGGRAPSVPSFICIIGKG